MAGGLRIAGSELKGNVDLLVAGFKKFHPDVVITTNFMTSSEGALGMMFSGASDVAPMGDDAKIPDQMPFYNTFRYVPTEISIATGGYDQRGTLFAWAIVVNKDNPDRQAFHGPARPYLRLRALGWLGSRRERGQQSALHRQVRAGSGDEHPQVGPARPDR